MNFQLHYWDLQRYFVYFLRLKYMWFCSTFTYWDKISDRSQVTEREKSEFWNVRDHVLILFLIYLDIISCEVLSDLKHAYSPKSNFLWLQVPEISISIPLLLVVPLCFKWTKEKLVAHSGNQLFPHHATPRQWKLQRAMFTSM